MDTGTLIVYEHSESVCCQKVRMVLEEKGLPYEARNVALEAGEQVTPAFLAVNPKGVVPVIVHNGRTIDESTIILEYLDDAFPETRLMPEDPYWRAKRRLWARRIDDGMHIPHIATISFIIAFNKAFRQQLDTQEKLEAYLAAIPTAGHKLTMQESFHASVESERMQRSIEAFDVFLADMEVALGESAWLAGPAFSLADIDVVPYIWRLSNLQLQKMWESRPLVTNWLSRMTQRPAFKRAVVDTALPAWIELMKSSGTEARAVVERMLLRNQSQSHL